MKLMLTRASNAGKLTLLIGLLLLARQPLPLRDQLRLI